MPRLDVKAVRERLAYSQEQLAQEVPVDVRTIRRWERGEVSPSPMAVARLRGLEAHEAREPSEPPEDDAPAMASSPPSSSASGPRRRPLGVVPSHVRRI